MLIALIRYWKCSNNILTLGKPTFPAELRNEINFADRVLLRPCPQSTLRTSPRTPPSKRPATPGPRPPASRPSSSVTGGWPLTQHTNTTRLVTHPTHKYRKVGHSPNTQTPLNIRILQVVPDTNIIIYCTQLISLNYRKIYNLFTIFIII